MTSKPTVVKSRHPEAKVFFHLITFYEKYPRKFEDVKKSDYIPFDNIWYETIDQKPPIK